VVRVVRGSYYPSVVPIQHFSSGVLSEVIRRQPSSPARTALAWQLAVGPALARATTVELVDGVLTVHSADARWAQEATRARDIVLRRLQHYLGSDCVRTLRVEGGENRNR
jgi:predicted nucleic acid-binding Zn ribbon protein